MLDEEELSVSGSLIYPCKCEASHVILYVPILCLSFLLVWWAKVYLLMGVQSPAISADSGEKYSMTDMFHTTMNLETKLYMTYITASKEEKYPNAELVSSKPCCKTKWYLYVLGGLLLLLGLFSRSLKSGLFRHYVTANSSYLTPCI